MSWIRNAREAREREQAKRQAPAWVGDDGAARETFRLHLYQVAAAQGVAFDRV